MNRTRIVALLGVLIVMLIMSAVPAGADPPERSDEPVILLFLDQENDLVVFWNITRDDFCEWEQSDSSEPPPVREPVTVRSHDTGQGAVVVSYHATRQVELWGIDDPGNPIGPCEDTAQQAGPWAAGDVTVTLNDNDVDVSGTRRNSFGDRGQGTVFDAVGDSWHYSWTFRAHCSVDCEEDFTLRIENITLKKKGR